LLSINIFTTMSRLQSGLLLALCAAIPVSGQVPPPVEIVGIRAMPYYASTGEIRRSTSLFDRRLVLRNVIIAPADGRDPLNRPTIAEWDIVFGTTATYVEFDLESRVRGAGVPSSLHVEMHAVAVDSRREVQVERVPIASVMPFGQIKWTLPFLVYGTGCERLEITLRVVQDGDVLDELSRTIPFSCGE
jgi:hypothetical protein